MNHYLTWVILGVIFYLLFFRKGGMGCCGGHTDSGTSHGRDHDRDVDKDIIDLDSSQYTVQVREVVPDKHSTR